MRTRQGMLLAGLVLVQAGRLGAAPASPAAPINAGAVAVPQKVALASPSMADLLAASQAGDWRPLDPENTLYLDLPAGRVVIELAPAFAPRYVANVKALVRAGYFDGTVVMRSQDNYVMQIGDTHSGEPSKSRPIGSAQRSVPAELDRPTAALPFAPLPDGDVYAPEVGHTLGFPVARDPKTSRTWLTHCYGMVGSGRDEGIDSGSGAELYVVIGHAPRHLDRNVTLLGRVVQGMELLSTFPRGTAPMGFYPEGTVMPPVNAVRVAADLPEGQRLRLEVLRTDTPLFQRVVEARRNRPESWFVSKAGRIDVCNVPLPVRVQPSATASH
jgi:peptidylprolyl isomerase